MLFKIHSFLLPDIIGIIPTIISEFSLIQFTRNKTHQKEKQPDNPAFLGQKPLTISLHFTTKNNAVVQFVQTDFQKFDFFSWQQNKFSLVQKKAKKILTKKYLEIILATIFFFIRNRVFLCWIWCLFCCLNLN